jgi:hypothetical protein
MLPSAKSLEGKRVPDVTFNDCWHNPGIADATCN